MGAWLKKDPGKNIGLDHRLDLIIAESIMFSVVSESSVTWTICNWRCYRLSEYCFRIVPQLAVYQVYDSKILECIAFKRCIIL